MQRYKFTVGGVSKAVQFLKGKSEDAPAWAKRFKDELKTSGGKVFYKGLEIIPSEKVEEYLRREMFKKDGTLPFGRDAAFHKLKQTVIGVPRRHLMRFIKSQDIFEHTKAAVPKAKSKGGKKLKTYTVETDLVFIRKNDLVNSNRRFEKTVDKEETYMVSTIEKSTGICRLSYVKVKEAEKVTPIVIKHIRSIAKALKVHPRSMAYQSDAGGEFNMKEIKKVVPDAKIVRVGSSIEKKNQDAQRVFYRVLKSRRSVDIPDALQQVQKLLNETYNRIQGASPNELLENSTKTFNIKSYNKARGSYIAGDKRTPFEVGQRVRIQIKKQKGIDLKFKSYKGETFSKRVYIVRKITSTSPRKYWVNSKWLTQDQLKGTEQEDQATKDLMDRRDKEQDEKDDKEEQKQAEVAKEKEKKRMVELAEKEKAGVVPRTRRTRFKDKLKAQREAGEALDRQLAEARPRKRRVVVRSTKYEREGEEEWVPGGKKKRKKRPKRVRRV